jgi:CheY-like chemotaxis protein/HPt (histidine-containing phosphotransfer) domain-containing protein
LAIEKENTAQSINNICLLVADNCASSRGALKNTVDMLGWKIDFTESAESTVRQVVMEMEKDNHYDVILLDWMLPDSDGLQAAKKIKFHYKDKQCSPLVIMVAAYSHQALLDHPEIDLVDLVISKPVTKSSLYNAVLQVMNKNKPDNVPLAVDKLSLNPLDGIRVLVVDDSEINLEVADLILQSQGAFSTTALSGQEALSWLQQHPEEVDVVLMDIQMPVMDGYAVTRSIRKDTRWKNLPIIGLSAGVFADLQDAAIDAGMNGFIAKPINTDYVVEEILQLTRPKTGILLQVEPVADRYSEQNTEQIEDYLGIDMEYGLRQWKNYEVYQTFLEKFAKVYLRAGDEIATLALQGDLAGALALSHKLRGAAGNLALKKVAEQVRRLEDNLTSGDFYPSDADYLQKLIREVCQSIAQLPVRECKNFSVDSTLEPDQQVLSLLKQLLDTLNQDNPNSVEPVLELLRSKIADADWKQLNEYVLNFNFRDAEQFVNKMMDDL